MQRQWPKAYRTQIGKRLQTSAHQQKAQKLAVADPLAQAKCIEKRAANVEVGIADLRQWLQDILREGLAFLPYRPTTFGFRQRLDRDAIYHTRHMMQRDSFLRLE